MGHSFNQRLLPEGRKCDPFWRHIPNTSCQPPSPWQQPNCFYYDIDLAIWHLIQIIAFYRTHHHRLCLFNLANKNNPIEFNGVYCCALVCNPRYRFLHGPLLAHTHTYIGACVLVFNNYCMRLNLCCLTLTQSSVNLLILVVLYSGVRSILKVEGPGFQIPRYFSADPKVKEGRPSTPQPLLYAPSAP